MRNASVAPPGLVETSIAFHGLRSPVGEATSTRGYIPALLRSDSNEQVVWHEPPSQNILRGAVGGHEYNLSRMRGGGGTLKPMLNSQRWVLIIGMLLIAWVLHVKYCDWIFKEAMGGQQGSSILRGSLFTIAHAIPNSQGHVHTGLATERGFSRQDAVWYGIAIPLALLTASAYLFMGVRHRRRIDQGRCTQCGYDLRGRAGGRGGGGDGGHKCNLSRMRQGLRDGWFDAKAMNELLR